MSAEFQDEGLGREVRETRRARAWSQEQLAGAAGVSPRTIQRVEAGDPCTGETLQALASALGRDVGDLTALTDHRRPGAPPPSVVAKARLIAGALLCAPLLWFVGANLLVHEMGQRWASGTLPPDVLDSPILLLGGPILAALILLPGLIRIRFRTTPDGRLLEGIVIAARPASALLLAVASVAVAVLVAYATSENLGHLVRMIQAG